ncbi:MAG: hypothetical protein JW737_05720 [Acidobacteria bacterium]|nr:hypothetical protein [Acidobacteriota bacterium]
MRFKKSIYLTAAFCLILSFFLFAGEAERFKLEFKDAYLIYDTVTASLQIITQGNVLSYGKDWEVVKMKPYLFALRLKTWKDFFWKVNTSRKEVYMIKDIEFPKMGGTSKTLENVMVKPTGDAMTPERFQLMFGSAYMAYLPDTKTQQIVTEGVVLSYCQDWEVIQLKPYLYHFKQNMWKAFFWHVNSSRKTVNRVSGGTFGQMGGDLKPLDIKLVTY